MVTVLAIIPTFIPLDTPDIPTPVVYQEERYERWWYQNTRSEWVVVEDCWSNPNISTYWSDMESSVRQMLVHTPNMSMVSTDLEWASDGFCIRNQGLEADVLVQREQYFDTLRRGALRRDIPIEETLDWVHYSWMEDKGFSLTYFQKRKLWDLFWQYADQRTVYTSAQRLPFEPLENTRRQVLSWPVRKKGKRRRPVATCNTQLRPEFPQIAVTIQATYDDLSSSEMRMVSSVLGDGVRSRLSQRLREELGFVYSIGSRFTGEAIEISYTVSPIYLVDSLNSVGDVLFVFSQTGPTAIEMNTARSMFLLRQYEILEEPASFVRMAGRFSHSDKWGAYIASTLNVIDAGTLTDKPIDLPDIQVWMTGPLNHPEVLTAEFSEVGKLCSAVQLHTK